MNENEKIFLSPKQVLNAIRIDFKQYDSQFDLFQELCPIITDNRNIVIKDGKNACMLITRGRKSEVRRMNVHDLGDYLFTTLNEKTYPLSIIADICSKAFQIKTVVGQKDKDGSKGIWIETEMAHFKCRQCGNCCRKLEYRNDCTEEDYRRWEALGRKDIIEKVMIIQSGTRMPVYKIWKEPGTSRLYPECPWLIPSVSKGRYECQIQDVKPEFCRQYPLTRKHAVMTGCKGVFEAC